VNANVDEEYRLLMLLCVV